MSALDGPLAPVAPLFGTPASTFARLAVFPFASIHTKSVSSSLPSAALSDFAAAPAKSRSAASTAGSSAAAAGLPIESSIAAESAAVTSTFLRRTFIAHLLSLLFYHVFSSFCPVQGPPHEIHANAGVKCHLTQDGNRGTHG